ncbi:MAG: hypothetical protein CEN87_778 [Parcubacteria group bacterium Licking1014_1]|nr:MAG: hypothetical protein CEN87_778 [Parcubacteria group bacterium Licking1014_1]
MARKVFFSFHYERDVWRAGQIRNSWVTKPDRETAGFWDSASWEEVKKKGEDAIHRWIDNQLNGTSVTVVLIGAETNDRPYVDYEIQQSSKIGNGLLAIYINNMKNQFGMTDTKGKNPFDFWHKNRNGQQVYFNQIYSTYDWVLDRGYDNLGEWVEKAAKDAGR